MIEYFIAGSAILAIVIILFWVVEGFSIACGSLAAAISELWYYHPEHDLMRGIGIIFGVSLLVYIVVKLARNGHFSSFDGIDIDFD